MARPNVTCAGCGKPMVSVREQGVARCNPCATVHGTRARYSRGCRCTECRAAVASKMREYTAARTARDGVSQFARYAAKKAEAEGREYVPEALRMVACAVCGVDVLKRDQSSPIPAMHRACRVSPEGAVVKRRALGIESPRMAAFRRKMERAAEGRPATKRVFIQGRCSWCEEQFCAPMGKWCSSKCKLAEKNALRHPERFNPTPRLRREVYERDGWVCGLCDLPIDSSLTWPHKWSASLDHVVPQSHMLIPDHSASNLRAVHLQCNSMRGDGSNMSEDELRRRALAEIGGGRLVAS